MKVISGRGGIVVGYVYLNMMTDCSEETMPTIRIIAGKYSFEQVQLLVWQMSGGGRPNLGLVYLDIRDGYVCQAPKAFEALPEGEQERIADAMVGHAIAAGYRFR